MIDGLEKNKVGTTKNNMDYNMLKVGEGMRKKYEKYIEKISTILSPSDKYIQMIVLFFSVWFREDSVY